ncbi:alpha/beta fold hydrolase [Saccharothrix longispora]|nr:alpha/beta fold hydrolase [Saccharothrix longispora]
MNGIRVNYEERGSGEPVLLVMGSGASGRAWHLHQVPALVAAGYRVITPDNRGIPPSEVSADPFTVHDMVADLVGLIEHLGIGACRLVGTSLGAYIVQELALARPDLVTQAVLIATRARDDVFRTALTRAEVELAESGTRLPVRYQAAIRAMRNLSRRTLEDDTTARDWLDLFELSPQDGLGYLSHLALNPMPDRRAAYRAISTSCLVIGFDEDLVLPWRLGREVADLIPGARFELVEGCGHYGYLENPMVVNRHIIDFFRSGKGSPMARAVVGGDEVG